MTKQRVTYQTYIYNNNTTNQYQSINVPVKNFSGLKILVTGFNSNTSTNTVYYNNSLELQPYICTMLGTATKPWSIDFNTNANEIDNTQITLRIPLGVEVTLIFKFYTL